jgi:hypothetical protein
MAVLESRLELYTCPTSVLTHREERAAEPPPTPHTTLWTLPPVGQGQMTLEWEVPVLFIASRVSPAVVTLGQPSQPDFKQIMSRYRHPGAGGAQVWGSPEEDPGLCWTPQGQ